jgi:DNA ligase (NAD+)
MSSRMPPSPRCVQLQSLPGFGPKKVQNILDAVEQSRSNPMHVLLFGLGIPGVGLITARLLLQSCRGDIMVWTPLSLLYNCCPREAMQ